LKTGSPQIPSFFYYSLDQDVDREFDYKNYQDLKTGSIILNVLKALTHDFYKRQNKYTLFELVFPNDYLNPASSFNKIHQALKRTRNWLLKNQIPLKIREEDEEYFLEGQVSIKIYLADRIKTFQEKKDESFYDEIQLLNQKFKTNSFSLREAMNSLKHSNLRKTQRFIKKAIEHNLIKKINEGKKTRYILL